MPKQKGAEWLALPALLIFWGMFYIVPGSELLPPIFHSCWSSRFGLKNVIHPSWVWIVSFFHVLLFFEMKAQDVAARGGVCFWEQKEQKHNNPCLSSVQCLYMCTLWLCPFSSGNTEGALQKVWQWFLLHPWILKAKLFGIWEEKNRHVWGKK